MVKKSKCTVAMASVVASTLLAACGGGGGSAPGGVTPITTAPQGTRSLGVTFAGTQTLATIRRTQSLAATPLTVTFNGTVVGTGTLDDSGHTVVKLTSAVPAGSTIVITAGRLTVTATLAMSSASTAVLITVNPDGTIGVTSASDPSGSGVVNPNSDEKEDEIEDDKGNVTAVTSTGGVLPANAPFTLTRTCTALTLTPASAAVASLKFEEKASDGESDDAGRVRFEGAFTGPLSFPVSSAAARLHIELFDAQHKRLIEVKAPITAFTSGTSTSPSPCPSPTGAATASPTPTPTGSPTGTPSPGPTGSPTTSPSPTGTPHS